MHDQVSNINLVCMLFTNFDVPLVKAYNSWPL